MTSKSRFAGERVKLASLCDKGKSSLRQKDIRNNGEYPVYGASGIIGTMDSYQNEHPYLAMVKDGAGVGRVMACEAKSSVLGTMQALLPRESADRDYLLHLVRSLHLERGLSGSTIPHIYYKDYGKQLVPAAPIEKQREVANNLGLIEGLALTCRKQLDLLDQLVKSQFVEMFETDDYPKKAASCFLRNIRNGLSPCREGMYKEKLLTLSAITRGAFDFESWKEGAFESRPPNNKRVSKGLFCVCRGNGNKALVGAAECSPVNRPDLVFPDTIIAAEIDEGVVCPDYLAMAWKSPKVRLQIEARARTTNGTYKINQEILKTIDIPVPPLALQQEFADFVAQVNKSEFAVRQQIEKLQTLYDSLAQEYFG